MTIMRLIPLKYFYQLTALLYLYTSILYVYLSFYLFLSLSRSICFYIYICKYFLIFLIKNILNEKFFSAIYWLYYLFSPNKS